MELEEKDENVDGKKAELQVRLKKTRDVAGKIPESHLFDVPGGNSGLQKKIMENSRNMKETFPFIGISISSAGNL